VSAARKRKNGKGTLRAYQLPGKEAREKESASVEKGSKARRSLCKRETLI